MNDEPLDIPYAYIDSRIESKIRELRENDFDPLQREIEALQRAVVEIKASLITQVIYLDCLSDSRFPREKLDLLKFELQSALSHLRGKLEAEELPDKAVQAWRSNVRSKLKHILTPQVLDALVSSSSSWDEIIGFASQD